MDYTYNRIISLVPSLTELIIDLGLKEQLIGRTRFCIHPKKELNDIPIIGGTKNPRIDKIVAMNPDFIIANKEENRKEDIQRLTDESDAQVEVTDIATLEDALLAIHQLGNMLGVANEAKKLIEKINNQLLKRPEVPPLKAAYFIWKDPWMSIGRDTYIHDVMKHWKLENIFASQSRYPEISLDELADYNPDLILLSSEPFPFKQKHLPEVQKACPGAHVRLVDGEWFSWYGSRMLYAFESLNTWRKKIT